MERLRGPDFPLIWWQLSLETSGDRIGEKRRGLILKIWKNMFHNWFSNLKINAGPNFHLFGGNIHSTLLATTLMELIISIKGSWWKFYYNAPILKPMGPSSLSRHLTSSASQKDRKFPQFWPHCQLRVSAW